MMLGMLDNFLECVVVVNVYGGDDGVLDDEEVLKWVVVEWLLMYDCVCMSLFYDKEMGVVKKMDVW